MDLRLFVFFILIFVIKGFEREPKLADFEKLRIDKDAKTLSTVNNIHVNWFAHSIKALMAQLGKDLYSKLPLDQKHALAVCLDKIDEKKDLVSSAKCLTMARKKYQIYQLQTANRGYFGPKNSSKILPPSRTSFIQRGTGLNLLQKPGRRLQKYSKKYSQRMFSTDHVKYKLDPAYSKYSRYNNVKRIKFQTDVDISRYIKFRKRAKRFTLEKLAKSQYYSELRGNGTFSKNNGHTWKIRSSKRLESLAHPKTPVGKVTNLISQFTSMDASNKFDEKPVQRTQKWSSTYKKLISLKTEMDKLEDKPGAKVYDFRMYDLVLDKKKPSMGPQTRKSRQGLVEMAMQFMDSISGKNKDGNTKILSPRFMPLMPDKAASKNGFLSPTLLALYEDDTKNKSIASIPSILKSTGVQERDRESIMELIMSATGTTKTVDESLQFLNNLNFVGAGKPIMTATEKLTGVMENLDKSLTEEQKIEMDRKGFTFMDKLQMTRLYKDEAVNFEDDALNFEEYYRLKRDDREAALWARIERIALNLPDDHPRFKREFVLLSVLGPVILAPYMFTPITGLTILGPVILSPNIFSPLILNPAVLSPYILSPAVAMPFILSPYLLSPYILTPLVMAPFILNPYVLSPNVINPYVLSPLILSPLVLCPDILSPQVLGGAILSPSVLSPAVLTESALMGNVLSPTFLS